MATKKRMSAFSTKVNTHALDEHIILFLQASDILLLHYISFP